MNDHSLNILGYSAVLEACRDYSIFALAPNTHQQDSQKQLIHNSHAQFELPFFSDGELLAQELRLLGIFKKCLEHSDHGIGDIPSVEGVIHLLEKEGSVPSIQDFENLSFLLYSYAELIRWLREERDYVPEDDASYLQQHTNDWEMPRELLKILRPYFNPQFREEEIPELRRVIRRIQSLNTDIQSLAQKCLSRNKSMWSSNEPTQRDGRVVLMVKSDFRSKVDGLVHGHSGSGHSMYIEPPELLEQNNALNEARSEYYIVIQGILKNCSALLRPFVGDMRQATERLRRFDSLQARARLGIAMGAQPARISRSDIILREARHPALGDSAVPISISIRAPKRIIVLSGPNTGGKTVAMKTLGLLALMHQSGMEIPASAESALPVFSDILVDIGDEQSIYAGLSTFSAHIRNIGDIVNAVLASAQLSVGDSIPADVQGGSSVSPTSIEQAVERAESAQSHRPNSVLVLLDELGTGTSPNEGAALALAIMETIAERNVHAMVTTHLDTLKAYAYKHPAMENASVAFNNNNPQYTIVLGIPGESHALKMARRMGMRADIIDRAEMYMDNDGLSLQDLIEDLRNLKTKLREQEQEYIELFQDIQNQQNELKTREQEVQQRELALKEQRLLEHSSYISESRRKIEALLRELNTGIKQNKKLLQQNSQKVGGGEQEREGTGERGDGNGRKGERADSHNISENINKELRQTLAEIDRAQEEAFEEVREAKKGKHKALKVGILVRCSGFSQPAEIISRGRKQGTWIVRAGNVKLTLSETEIESVIDSDGAGSAKVAGGEQGARFTDSSRSGASLSANSSVGASARLSSAQRSTARSLPAHSIETDAHAEQRSTNIDIRGMRMNEALSALDTFLDRSTLAGLEFFSVIHGKGNGVLQECSHRFLKEQKQVKRICFAPPEDGGFGKTYVYLA